MGSESLKNLKRGEVSLVRLPQLAWYGTKELELPLPDSWQVEVYNMAGFDRPAMKLDEIKVAIANLIGSPPIRELARGKNEVVIIFDDMTRVTRVAELVPFVLEELAETKVAVLPNAEIQYFRSQVKEKKGASGAVRR